MAITLAEQIKAREELIKAINENNLEKFMSLIGRVDINAKDNEGSTLLHEAAGADGDNVEIFQYLLKNGADINDTDSEGRTALHWSSVNGNKNITKFILDNKDKYNVNLDAKDNNGKTSIFKAMFNDTPGRFEIVKLLIENGANLESKDLEGKTPLHYAYIYGLPEIKALLEKNGAKDIPDNSGVKPSELVMPTHLDVNNQEDIGGKRSRRRRRTQRKSKRKKQTRRRK